MKYISSSLNKEGKILKLSIKTQDFYFNNIQLRMRIKS